MHVKCGRNVLKTRRYDSALSTHFSFSTAAKLQLSSACVNYQVESQARACYVTQFTYKS